jgi:hypothetical protein
MGIDPFQPGLARLIQPFQRAVAVTPSDTVDIAFSPALQAGLTIRGLYIGVTGDVSVITSGGDTVLFKAAPVGLLQVRAARVRATGTTATNILALA